jgi:hypothetical protein
MDVKSAKGESQHHITSLTFYEILALAFFSFLFFSFILPSSKSFPYSDDWSYIGISGNSNNDLIRWFLVPHNEHFIPVMKAAQFFILNISNFDFRALITLNFFSAILASVAAIKTAKRYRGFSHFGDLMIPVVLINMSFNVFAWGFSAQFAVSIAAAFSAVYFLGEFLETRGRVALSAMTASILLCASMGANGLILSFSILACILIQKYVNVYCDRMNFAGKSTYLLPALGAVAAAGFLFVIARVGASNFSLWFYQMSKSGFGLFAIERGGGTFLFIVAASFCAAFLLFRRRITGYVCRASILETAIVGLFLGTALVCLGIVFGRADRVIWFPGLEMHYGFLMTPFIIIPWIILSNYTTGIYLHICATIFVVVSMAASLHGALWRYNYVMKTAPLMAEIEVAIRSSEPPLDIANRYIREFFYLDEPRFRESVANGIQKLRSLRR